MGKIQTWNYKGLNSITGKSTKGRIQAPSKDQAIEILSDKDVVPLNVTRVSSAHNWLTEERYSKASHRDVALFIRGFSTAMSSNMRTEDALLIAANGVRSSALKHIAKDISQKYANGVSLSDAFAEHSKIFGAEVAAIVEAGQASGQTHLALLALADAKERSSRIRGKVISSLIYPAVVLSAAFGALIVVIVVVLPKVQTLVDELGMEMPTMTKYLVVISDILKTQSIAVLVVAVISIVVVSVLSRTPKGRHFKSYVAMKSPLFGKVVQGMNTSMLCELCGVMLSAGVAQVRTMELLSLSIRNHSLASELKKIPHRLMNGLELDAACKISVPPMDPVIPALAQQTTSGLNDPGKPWKSYGAAMAEETDRRADTLKSSIEPVMVIIVGLIIGLMAAAVYMPMLQVYDFMNTLE